MDVEFTVEVRKRARLSGPRVETVGAQPEFQSSLDRTLQLATSDMVRWLAADYKLAETPEEYPAESGVGGTSVPLNCGSGEP